MLLVERVYPNVIDLCSDLGGIIKVLVFLCIATGMLHNQILFDKYLLETIFSSESIGEDSDKNKPEGKKGTTSFSYKDVFILGYCCQKKTNPKKKEFDEKMETISKRMDISNIV